MKHILRCCVSVPVNESISTQPCTYIKLQFSYITLKAFSDNLNVGHCETVFSPSRTLSYNFEIPTSTIQLIFFVNLQERKKEGWFCKKNPRNSLEYLLFSFEDFYNIIFHGLNPINGLIILLAILNKSAITTFLLISFNARIIYKSSQYAEKLLYFFVD